MSPEQITIIGVGVALAALMLAGFSRVNKRIDRLEDRLLGLERRVGALEQRVARIEGMVEMMRDSSLDRIPR